MASESIDPRFVEYAATGDRDLRDELILDNRGLAIAFAQRYRERGVALDDLQQTAMEALVRAVDRFEPERGLRFSTFAGRTIDGELKQYFRDRTWSVHVARSTRQLATAVRSVTDTLTQELRRAPTPSDIAERLRVEVSDVLLAMEASAAARTEPIDTDPGVIDAGGDLDRVDAAIVAPQLLQLLPDDDRRVLELRFFDGRTQAEIADVIGVSQMQVSRILRRALERLRSSVGPVD